MDGTGTEPGSAPEETASPRKAHLTDAVQITGARERYLRVRDQVNTRVNAGATGQFRRRLRDLDVLNHGLILASLGLTLLIPLLITLAALLPIGSDTGFAATLIRRFGLSPEAADDLRQLFPTHDQVAGSTTPLSAVVTLLWALGWPAELARGLQAIWELPSRGLQDLWRALPWLASFVGMVSVLVGSSTLADGSLGTFIGSVLTAPLLFGWTWWSQHLLLGGRIRWRPLLPSAIATTVALFGFGVVMSFYVPGAIVSNFDQYGPIGVIFALLTWLVGFAVVMLGGPLVGHTIYLRRQAS
ncbi:MAG: YhjD/YihY/BrkB family envelope integrity protein [Jatrophihabitantaceae bacterium]